QRVPNAEVCRDNVPRLHPAEDPWDGAEVGERTLSRGGLVAALGGTRADARVFELGNRCGLLEVLDEIGIVEDVLLVKRERCSRDLVEHGLPRGINRTRQVSVAAGFAGDCEIGPRDGVDGGSDQELEVALGEHDIGVLPVEDLALLGDAELAVEAVQRLRIQRTMGWPAATAYRASAAMKEPQRDAAFACDPMQIAVGLPDLPRRGDHAAVLVGVGVTEHHLLPALPCIEQRNESVAGPELAADCRRIAEVLDGFEKKYGLHPWIGAIAFHVNAAEPREPQDLERIFGTRSAGDNVVGDRLGVLLLDRSEHAKRGEDLGGLRRKLLRELQPSFAERALPRAELFDSSGVYARVLAQIECVQMQPEGANRKDQ